AYLASTRFDKIHQKIQRRRVLRSFARANISQMQRENAKQYKILRAFCLPQVQIFAAQNRVSSTLFGYKTKAEVCVRLLLSVLQYVLKSLCRTYLRFLGSPQLSTIPCGAVCIFGYLLSSALLAFSSSARLVF
ncbi:MAG: hypothetical protein II330_08305, partial [Clostridia bacterium]|nr:hypothetical protein [Clostridia bacterium]MBQ2256852.1 hypothetical protein [Clostridia bacterium]